MSTRRLLSAIGPLLMHSHLTHQLFSSLRHINALPKIHNNIEKSPGAWQKGKFRHYPRAVGYCHFFDITHRFFGLWSTLSGCITLPVAHILLLKKIQKITYQPTFTIMTSLDTPMRSTFKQFIAGIPAVRYRYITRQIIGGFTTGTCPYTIYWARFARATVTNCFTHMVAAV